MSFINDFQVKEVTGVTPKSIIIYGPPKKGKTTLACKIAEQVGLTVPLNCENRVGHINESDVLRFWPSRFESCDLKTAQSLLNYIKSNRDHGIKAIVIDTIDSLIESEKRKKRLQSGKALNFSDRDVIHFQVLELIKDFKDQGLVVVIVSHDKTDTTKQKVTLSLDKDFVVLVNKMCDYIFYLSEENGQRKLITSSEFYETGASLNIELGETLEREYINPTWPSILPNLKAVESTTKYVTKYVTKDQQMSLLTITEDIDVIKEVISSLGYQSSAEILTEDFENVVQSLKNKVENLKSKLKSTEQNQCTFENYTDLINNATSKEVLETIREHVKNEFSYTREQKGNLELLISTRMTQLVA